MREDVILQQDSPALPKPRKWLRTISCWTVVVLTMPVVNFRLIKGESALENVFVGIFLAVLWSFLAGVLMWRKAGMGTVLLVQLVVLAISARLALEGIPDGLPEHVRAGHGLMNAIMHGGEAVVTVLTAGVMRLTLYRHVLVLENRGYCQTSGSCS